MSGSISLKSVFGIILMLTCSYLPGICQESSGCIESYFSHNGACLQCPDQCETCTSYSNCTRCNDNFYGPACQHECRPECDGLCHKKYGHCTFGCSDGRFYNPEFQRCHRCRTNCKLCTSKSRCLECHPGYYNETCVRRCRSHTCRQCDQSTGMCMKCKDRYFSDEMLLCRPCLKRCATCISGTECTKCKDYKYGPKCQHTCPQECDGLCHLEYGYCTHGCPDGQYQEEDTANCSICPMNCTLCKSSVECASCRPRYYGNTCEFMCTNHCGKCNQASGRCLVCEEGYFKLDDRCHGCPEGCAGCSDIMNCSGCIEGYSRLHDGHCIMECSQRVHGTYLIASDKQEYGSKYMHSKTDVCTNIENDQGFELKTGTPCLKYMPCPSNDSCPSKDNHPGPCAALLTYECTYLCQPLNESFHQCEKECNTNSLSTHNLTSCLNSSGPVIVDNVSTSSECLQADANKGVSDHRMLAPILISTFVGLAMCINGILCFIRHRRGRPRFTCKSTREQTDEKAEAQFGIEESTEVFVMIHSNEMPPTKGVISEKYPLIDQHEATEERSGNGGTAECTDTCILVVSDGNDSSGSRLPESLMVHPEPHSGCGDVDETEKSIEPTQEQTESLKTCPLAEQTSGVRLIHEELSVNESQNVLPESKDNLNEDSVTETTKDAMPIHAEETVVEPENIRNDIRTESETDTIGVSAEVVDSHVNEDMHETTKLV